MSVEAMSWALNLAPGPGRPGRVAVQRASSCSSASANYAGPDETAALPSVARLARYTGLSERTVRACLDQLAAEASSHPAPRDIVAAQIKRADRRRNAWTWTRALSATT